MPVQVYLLWDVAWFPRGSVKTHYPYAIHPFSTDSGKPHITPWGCGVGPRSPTYSETDLPQGQVPGYPPPADVPGSHSSLGINTLTIAQISKDTSNGITQPEREFTISHSYSASVISASTHIANKS
jgi:hypothetical protein